MYKDSINVSNTIQSVNNNNHYDDKIQKFEDEIDFQLDKVLKSIQLTANMLSTHKNEK